MSAFAASVHPVRVALPAHLRNLAQVGSEVELEVAQPVCVSSILDALEERYPMLRGTIRDHVTRKRRPFLRYDLELLAPRLVGVEGSELALPAERLLAAGADPVSSDRWFWLGLIGAVVVLLVLLVRLLRGEPPAAAEQ